MTETNAERKGYVKRLATRLEEGADQVMKAWSAQAKRPDRVGEVSYRGLELVHGGLRVAARYLSHLERGTQPPHRPATPEPHMPVPESHAHATESRPRRRRPAPAQTAPAHHGQRPEPEASAS